MSEMDIDNLTFKTYTELTTVGSNTGDEVFPTRNISGSEDNHEVLHKDHRDGSSGSEYILSEFSSSSTCESFRDSDKIKSKQIYISTENTSDFPSNSKDIETLLTSKDTNCNFNPETKTKRKFSPIETKKLEKMHIDLERPCPLYDVSFQISLNQFLYIVKVL